MTSEKQKIERVVHTRRLLDEAKSPPEYVDEVLPTTSKHLLVTRSGRFRAPHGTVVGSLRITGSHYDFAPGTYSFRITRLSVDFGTSFGLTGTPTGGFALWHSRAGTVEFLRPIGGDRQSMRILAYGKPYAPLYTFGPGTLFYGFQQVNSDIGTHYWMSAHIEGLLS